MQDTAIFLSLPDILLIIRQPQIWHLFCNVKTKNMRKHPASYLFLVLFACMVTSVHAQKKGYSWGYVVHLNGDTIEGWIKDRSSGTFGDLYVNIRFKSQNALFRKKYGPEEILAYSANAQIYESVPLREEAAFFKFSYPVLEGMPRQFLKVVTRDRGLTYYHWEYMDDDSNYLDYIPLFYRDGYGEMVRVTQGILGLKRNKLIRYFGDCPDLVFAIQAKQLNGIDEVFDFYVNHCAVPYD